MYRGMYRKGSIVTVLIVCDRCRREVAVCANEMPSGWVRPALTWIGDEEDICERCLTLVEQQALAGPIEIER